MTDERYKITCRLCDKTSEIPAPDPDEPAFLNCPHCGGRLEIRWREPMEPSAPFLGTTDTEPIETPEPEPAESPEPKKKNGKKAIVSVAILGLLFSINAKAQACPGGFWGNGQCIAPCESPLVNPNVSLAFYGYLCQAQPPCENNYVYCYPTFTAYDNAYNQYCGVITDWNDGGCYAQPPMLNQLAPKRRDDEQAPFYFHSFLRLTIVHRPARTIKHISIKSRFWWKEKRLT